MLRILWISAAIGCASAPGPAPAGASSFDVEQLLSQASVAIDEGDGDRARLLLSEADTTIERDLAKDPDRHQLEFTVRELRYRLAAPRPAAVSDAPAPEVVSTVIEEWVVEDAVPAPAIPDPIGMFRAGPVRDHREGTRLVAKGKRAKSAKKKQRSFERARAALERCVSQGEELIQTTPDLEGKRFSTSKRRGKRLSADAIVRQCKSKLRWVDRKLGAPSV
jgi:hypothetical protein